MALVLGLGAVKVLGGPLSPYLETDGDRLELLGGPHPLVGVNAYSLGTVHGVTLGCGAPLDVDQVLGELAPGTAVRVWAWQGSMATNPSYQRDWRALDRVVLAAEERGLLLIMSLTSQGGECDDGKWKDAAWYEGGYRTRYNDEGYAYTTQSYLSYVRQIVSRYRDSKAVAIWEPVNEPEASECPDGLDWRECSGRQTCPDEDRAATALRRFFDYIGREIKRYDPNHLVGTGALGSGQCGMSDGNFAYVGASPYVDVLSYHDYGFPTDTMPGDRWNGLARRLDQADRLGKPLIIGEAGIQASDSQSGCPTRRQRADLLGAKAQTALREGADGFLIWNRLDEERQSCTYDVSDGDPSIGMLEEHVPD